MLGKPVVSGISKKEIIFPDVLPGWFALSQQLKGSPFSIEGPQRHGFPPVFF